MRNRIGTVLLFGVAAVIVIIFWRPAIVAFTDKNELNDQLNFLSLISTIMGISLTIGGLIVALVAVFTLFTVESRVEQKFRSLYEEKDIENRKRINQMFQGYSLQLQSISTNELFIAEGLTQRAIEYYPELPEARRQMGLRFYEATLNWFLSKITPESLTSSLQRSFDGAGHVYSHEQNCRNYKPKIEWDYSLESIRWLGDAFERGEDQDGNVSLSLSKLYGIHNRASQMLKSLEVAAGKLDCRPQSATDIIPYLPACSDESVIRRLGELINVSMPLQSDAIGSFLNEVDTVQQNGIIKFLAKRKNILLMFPQDRAKEINFLMVFRVGDGFRVRWERDDWSHSGKRYEIFPNEDEQPLTTDALLEFINEKFWIIHPM